MSDIKGIITGLECLKTTLHPSWYETIDKAVTAIKVLSVKENVLEQIKWERNRAMEQLESNGLRFGHKDDYGWIPCKERLPEEDGNYYCHVVHYVKEDFECHDEYIVTFYKGKWLTHVLDTYKVLAWRKLPEVYSEV